MMPTNPDFPTTPSLEEMEQLLERKPTIQDQVDSRYTPGRFADNVDRTMLDNPYTKEMTENSLANRFQQRVDDEKYYDEGQYLNRGKTLGLTPSTCQTGNCRSRRSGYWVPQTIRRSRRP
jgi:hypothetical protein